MGDGTFNTNVPREPRLRGLPVAFDRRDRILNIEQFASYRQGFGGARGARCDRAVGHGDESPQIRQCGLGEVEPLLREVERDPCHTRGEAEVAFGESEAGLGGPDVGTGYAVPGASLGQIGYLLLDADGDLRGKLPVQFERRRAGYGKVQNARAQSRVGQFIGSFGRLSLSLDPQLACLQRRLLLSRSAQRFLIADLLRLGSMGSAQSRQRHPA